MSAIGEEKTGQLPVWFGDFGGILIPDSFVPDVLQVAEDGERLLPGERFRRDFEAAVAVLPPIEVSRRTWKGLELWTVPAQTAGYSMAGHMALAAGRGVPDCSVGVERAELGRAAAAMAGRLGLKLHVVLSRELAADKGLKEELTASGCAVDDTTCGRLYNRPQAYAFQRFIGDRKGSSFIPTGAELGCYPFPALSGLFAQWFGQRVRKLLPGLPDVAAATTRHGNSALAVARAFGDAGCALVSVEAPVCQSYSGEYCGGSFLFARSAAPAEYNYTICAELSDLWRMAKVIRLGAESYLTAGTEEGMAPSTVRGAELIRQRLGEAKTVLMVEGEYE